MENVFLSKPEELQQLQRAGKLAYGQLPLVETDGLNLVQSQPAAEYLAEKYGFWPDGAKERYLVGLVMAGCKDARGCFVSAPFSQPPPEKLYEELKQPKALLVRYCPTWEAMLGERGGPFVLGTKATVADIIIFEVLDAFIFFLGEDRFKESFAAFPNIVKMRAAVLELGTLKAWVQEERPSQYLPLPQYRVAVDNTLGR